MPNTMLWLTYQINGPVVLITCAELVGRQRRSCERLVGLFAAFLPTIIHAVRKWVGLYYFNPREYTRLFPTHFTEFTPVKFLFSTFSTRPINNESKVNEYIKGEFWS
jgi:hypothetical protein